MKTKHLLAGAALLSSVVDCLPQILIPNRSTSKVSVVTDGVTLGDPFTLPPGVTLPPGFTIGTDLTRTGTLPGFTFGTPPGTVNPPLPTSTRKPTSSSIKTTSSTSKPTSTTKPPPPPSTTSTTSSSRFPPQPPTTKTPSSTTKSSRSTTPPPPPTTKSTSTTTSRSLPPTPTVKSSSYSTKSTRSTPPPPPQTTSKTTSSTSKSTTPPITQPPTTSETTSSAKTTPPPVTATAKLPASTNPYSASCPIPSSYTINNFLSYDGPGGDVALTITYGDGVFTCPNKFEHSTSINGRFTLDCDDDGLVRVVTDGVSYLYVQEKFWCDEVPGPSGSYATLQSSANHTFPSDTLFCETDNINIRTCLQLDPDIAIPVQTYSTGGTISFTPLDIDGDPMPQCPTIVSAQPIVSDPATCGVPTPTTTGKGTTSVRFTQTATVTINV